MKNKISVVLVVYNQSCEESLTCQTILQNTVQPDTVLVMDNSTGDFSNMAFCKAKGWQYHSMSGNQGLSKAYNAALDILDLGGGAVVWADDDTSFPKNYFSELSVYLEKEPEKLLFLPTVFSNNKMISPSIAEKYRVISVGSTKELENRFITAINSGMAVRAEVYSSYRYDERLFLDCIDHDFMRWCRQNKKEICIMENVILQQSFFSDSRPKKKQALIRYRIFSKDFQIYASKKGNNKFITKLQLLKNRIHLELTCDRHK